jgi:hypothetical protein
MDTFTYVGQVEKPVTDRVTAAIELIEEKARKVSYDSKQKWLKFEILGEQSEGMAFLKAIRSKMASQLRRTYGNSRQLNVNVTLEAGVPTLYVHSDRY